MILIVPLQLRAVQSSVAIAMDTLQLVQTRPYATSLALGAVFLFFLFWFTTKRSNLPTVPGSYLSLIDVCCFISKFQLIFFYVLIELVLKVLNWLVG